MTLEEYHSVTAKFFLTIDEKACLLAIHQTGITKIKLILITISTKKVKISRFFLYFVLFIIDCQENLKYEFKPVFFFLNHFTFIQLN